LSQSFPHMKNPPLPCLVVLLAAGLVTASLSAAPVAVDLRSLFNARIVTTLTDGQLAPWREALDGVTSGEATRAAAERIGEPFAQALPDDGVFPATARHPRIALAFGNADGHGNQVRRSLGADEFSFAVPAYAYREFWIFVMSGNGESHLRVDLKYADGTIGSQELIVPDWYFPVPADDPHRLNLAEDLGKWSRENRLMEKDHHYLHGLDLRPDSSRVLVAVTIHKAAPAALTLWGATGITP
jgi:hypothetical protein